MALFLLNFDLFLGMYFPLIAVFFMAGTQGFEPQLTESKSVVLPLHYVPIISPITVASLYVILSTFPSITLQQVATV